MLRNLIEESCAARAIAARRAAFVAERAARVARIKVTTESGNVFDGDETSQNQMARFVAMAEDGDTIRWVLADNSVIQVTRAELKEALTLAGQAQAQLWVEAE
ncbi:hypothetical protein BTW08_13320 [Salinicola sp. MH3R3-1]|uniref:DUF4376 domain-containing protein n=1 Tax=Salinicola sp. MH3R3-1 TaxID=1928762 RepID=UPI00094E8D88|nr:hypothetical protein [Salinicola sp. MH3R3-1]OLO07229.1 hypothetical protein BTW08_13320 [Salinicola sp. MH3R3-1]